MKQYNVVECSIYKTQRILKHKWIIVILHALYDGEKMFNELLKVVTYISNAQLAMNLELLVSEEIIVCNDGMYSLSQSGIDLYQITREMKQWSQKYR